MDDIRPFLDDIITHPHDDAPRLILADWIEENVERLPPSRAAALRAQGEFIRVQYALEGMHSGNPRRPGLLALQNALLQGHKSEWAASLAFLYPQPQPPEVRFRRGFIEHASVTAAMLPAVSVRLRQAVPLRSLAVAQPRVGNSRREQTALVAALARAEADPLLEQLEELDLSAAHFPTLDSSRAWMNSPRLGRLRKLVLQGNVFEATSLLDGRLRTSLRHLEFRCTPWSQSDQRNWPPVAARFRGAALPLLESLAVAPELFDNAGVADLLSGLELPVLSRFAILPGRMASPHADRFPVGLLSKTRAIDFSGTPAHSLLEALEEMPPTPALETLSLAGCMLDADQIRRLGRVTDRFPALWSLGLRTNRLGDDGAREFAASPLLQEVRALDLSYCRIGSAGARVIADRLPAGLVSLDLSWNALDAGATDALSRAGSLQTLDLSYCGLGDEAALALANLPPGKLHSLNLGSNRLTDLSARVLVRSPALAGLEALDLSSNLLTDGFADDLLDSPLVRSLRLLVVFGNELSAGGAARLRAGFRGIVG